MTGKKLINSIDFQIAKKLFVYNNVKSKNDITVIIPFRGKERVPSLKVCIDYIYKQNVEDIEIIVVEEDVKSVLEIDDRIKHIFLQSDRKFNKSKAINIGVMNSKNNFICMNDVDMIMQDGYLERICKVLKINEVGNMGKDIYYLDEIPVNDNFIFSGRQWSDGARFHFHGGNVFFRKDAFLRIGGMDENFVGHGSEDSEFYLRAKRATKFYDIREMFLLHMPHPQTNDDWHENERYFRTVKNMPIQRRIVELRKSLLRKR